MNAISPHKNRKPKKRRSIDRRQLQDQRAEIRFEPGVQNRRQLINRRADDADCWKAGSQED